MQRRTETPAGCTGFMSTITFQCYSCQQTLKVGADKAGRKAKCVKCGTVLTIPAGSSEAIVEAEPTPARNTSLPSDTRVSPKGPPPLPRTADEVVEAEEIPLRRGREDDDDRPRRGRRDDDDDRDDEDRDDEDRRQPRFQDEDDEYDEHDDRRRRRSRQGKARVFGGQIRALTGGLTCFYWKWYLMTAATCVAIVALVLVMILGSSSPRAAAVIWLILAVPTGLGGIASVILGIVGASLTVRVPPATGYRGLAIALLVLEPAPLCLCLVAIVAGGLSVRDPFAGAWTGVACTVLAMLAFIAGFVLFMLFLRGLGFYTKDRHTARSALTAMIQGLVTFIVGPILLVALVRVLSLMRLPPVASITILLIFYLAWVVALILLMMRVTQIIAVVRGRL
jgi:hypothetical protein